MAVNPNAMRSGIFIVAAAIVSLAVVIVVSGPERFAAKVEYKAKFQIDADLQGVRAGDEVRIGGVRAGTVRSVVVNDIAEIPTITVTFAMPKKFTLREGSTISVGGLIGSAWLNIDSLGGPGAPPLQPGETIEGQPSALTKISLIAPKIDGIIQDVRTKTLPAVDRAIDQYRALAADAQARNLPAIESASKTAQALLEDVRAQIKPMVDRYAGVTEAAKIAATNIGDFIGPGEGAASLDFRKSLANIKDSTGKIKEELPELTASAKQALKQINDRLEALKGTAEDLRLVMSNARDVSAEVREILLDNRPKIDRIIASVEATTNNAKAFTAEVLRRPSRLLWKDDPKTQGNLTVYHTAREFGEGAQELNDAAATLREAMRDPRVSEDEIKRLLETLQLSFDRFNKVEEKLYKSVQP